MMHPNPASFAREAQQMAKHAKGKECEIFQRLALVTMGVMAAATASQVLLQLWREINRQEKGRGR